MGDKAAQNLCLLPPEHFVKEIEASPQRINKSEFIKVVSSNNQFHDELVNTFSECYKDDTFYNEVDNWYDMDPAETPTLPKGQGSFHIFRKNQTHNLRVDKDSTSMTRAFYFI